MDLFRIYCKRNDRPLSKDKVPNENTLYKWCKKYAKKVFSMVDKCTERHISNPSFYSSIIKAFNTSETKSAQ